MDVIEHSNGAIHEIGWNGQEFIPLQLHISPSIYRYALFGLDAEFLCILCVYSSTNLP